MGAYRWSRGSGALLPCRSKRWVTPAIAALACGVAAPALAADPVAPAPIAEPPVQIDASAWQLPVSSSVPQFAMNEGAAIDRTYPSTSPADYGPEQTTDSPPAADAARGHVSFGGQIKSVAWETAAFAAYLTAINVTKLTEVGARPFHFQNEGYFGKSTYNLGIDKLAHAYDTYLIAEVMRARIDRKTDDSPGSAYAAAAIASGLMLYGEFYDGIKKSSGFSLQDVVFNIGGAGFSILRHQIPGLADKLDFRVEVVPNGDVFTFSGQRHYAQQHYLLALKLSGFERFQHSPLRFLELHAGYYATGITPNQRADGDPLHRRPFVGIGVNLGELFFHDSSSRIGRAAGSVLDYVQIPYTALNVH